MRWPWRRNEDREKIAKAESDRQRAAEQLARTRALTSEVHALGATLHHIDGLGVSIEAGMGRRKWRFKKS